MWKDMFHSWSMVVLKSPWTQETRQERMLSQQMKQGILASKKQGKKVSKKQGNKECKKVSKKQGRKEYKNACVVFASMDEFAHVINTFV